MGQHFKLTSEEYNVNTRLFKILEIKAKQVVDKNYEELSAILKKQHKELILVNHSDKGGNRDRFDKAYQELKKYIEPLESGNPCVKVSVDAESDGRLTAREFHYRKKLFSTLGIGEEAIGGDYEKLNSILQKKFYEDCANDDTEQLRSYISPLGNKKDLVDEDKKQLALKFIKHFYDLLLVLTRSILPLNPSYGLAKAIKLRNRRLF